MSERPVECGGCKRSIDTVYTEVGAEGRSSVEMCSACPVLQSKLQGGSAPVSTREPRHCTLCQTSEESVKMGHPLGCSECYAVFAEMIVEQLLGAHAIPAALQEKALTEKSLLLYHGKPPTPDTSSLLSSQLLSLTEALSEALKKENYEQAASLRDQIKEMIDPHG